MPASVSWVRRGAPRPGSGQPAHEPDPDEIPWPGRLLRYPPIMRGDDVRTWQERLRELGYEVEVDGAYGPQTRGATREFQRDQGIAVDGVVGPETWEAAFEIR